MATKDIYVNPGAAKTWKDSAGDFVMTMASLATAGGRIGAQWDRGAGAQPALYRWQFRWRANTAPTVGNLVRLYLAIGDDGTYISNGLGTADAAVASEALCGNCLPIDSVEVTEAVTTRDFVKAGLIWIRSRYVSPIVFNASGVSFHATSTNQEFRLTAVPDQIQ